MESSTTLWTILGTIAATLFSEKIILLLWSRFFPSKKEQAQAVADISALNKQIEEVVASKMTDGLKIMKLESDKSGLELELRIKQGMIDDYKDDMKRFFEENGAAKQREKRCQDDLDQALRRITELERAQAA